MDRKWPLSAKDSAIVLNLTSIACGSAFAPMIAGLPRAAQAASERPDAAPRYRRNTDVIPKWGSACGLQLSPPLDRAPPDLPPLRRPRGAGVSAPVNKGLCQGSPKPAVGFAIH